MLQELREDFVGIVIEILHRLRHNVAFDFSLLRQCKERRDDGALGIDFEKAAQAFARVTAAKAICAEGQQSSGNPWRDLHGHGAHVIGDGHERPLFFLEQCLDVRPWRGLSRMEHVPAAAIDCIGAQLLVARGAPHVR